jgi:hypothetical protein
LAGKNKNKIGGKKTKTKAEEERGKKDKQE